MWYTDGDQVSETQIKFGKKGLDDVFSRHTSCLFEYSRMQNSA